MAVNEDLVLAEAYGAMQTFRHLGFPSANLYLAFGVIAVVGPYKGQKCVAIKLVWRGKDFIYHIAPVANDREFASRWSAFTDVANRGPRDDTRMQRMVQESYCFQNVTELVAALEKKGMSPPGRSS